MITMNTMNINNIFNFANKELISNNTLIKITEYEFWLSILSINCGDALFNYYTDEWLYLINYNYPNSDYYHYYITNYITTINELNNNKDDIVYYNNIHVLSLVVTFSRGSVHGYSSFWFTLITFMNDIDSYKNIDIIIYKDIDQGMLSIITYLCNKKLINNKIIFLEKNKKYFFSSVTYIKNEHHVFNNKLENMVFEFIQKYEFINKSLYISNNECTLILKSNLSNTNISQNGVFNDDIVNNFCKEYNIHRLYPSNEIELINNIYNSKIVILNYGSTFFKNYVYISDLCKKIIVIVNGNYYINDYNHLSNIITNKYQGIIYNKYKNANIYYIKVNNNLNFNPYTL